ncbi:hypothetical protein YH65_10300 [Sulfurovum lithotrophicum]|uniref:Uncharacterized protein n=1 Tax=Sulfurovum lithotrophicum TaxID=206403 RepID=A0A7U4M2L9_9BACT|nr:hypothetical protein [Sulfurovum lithotrophicum]AKF25733.1 hypothetical protein YH65_10300 [Sulfurovum lithotrophicum]
MKQITVLEKYPVFTLEVNKGETSYTSIDEIFAFLRSQIEAHPIATYIGEFDHYAHTSSLEEGKINEEIKAAKNIICCFGKVLPKPEVLAVRPRSIGVAEMTDSFVISFLEAPNPDANGAMEKWVKDIVNTKH